MNKTEKITFNTTLILFVVIIVSSLIIFMLTPSPISPTKLLFGYINNVYIQDKTAYIEFDRAEWFMDTEKDFPASFACWQDDECNNCPLPIDRSCVPNGYYIRNPNTELQKFPVTNFTKVGTLIINPEWNSEDPESQAYRTLTFNEFLDIFTDPSSPHSHIKYSPFNITIFTGQIIIIKQHYIP